MSDIATRWRAALRRVADACGVVGRDPRDVSVLAAVKTQDSASVVELLRAGCTLLGENRAQELIPHRAELARLWPAPFEMHFIGHLQSNKVNQVVPRVDCVQSVDGLALARRLGAAAERLDRELAVFVQVNPSGEPTKSGAAVEQAVDLACEVAALPGLRLRGLMSIGAHSPDLGAVRASHEAMAELSAQLLASGAPGTGGARELSMGMSGDLELAIAAGSTMVRLGTALFGPRNAGGTAPSPERGAREGIRTLTS